MKVTHAQLQDSVVDTATRLGYSHFHPYDSRRSDPGWPDLVLVHPGKKRVVFMEIKTEDGVITPAQTQWHDDLAACDQEVYVVFPEHWDSGEVAEILTLMSKPSKLQRANFESAVVKL